MSAYYTWMKNFDCTSYHELYSLLEKIAKDKLGMNKLPFTLSALEHPPGNVPDAEIIAFLVKVSKVLNEDESEDQVIQLIKFLKDNPPKESYENPKLPTGECTMAEKDLMNHIFLNGIDLPGAQHNPFGHLQYFSSFFIDMFFGNYTEFMEHINKLSKNELKKELKRREGHCQYSPIFAPILGLQFINFDSSGIFTSKEIEGIKRLYNGANENKHLEILKKLVKLGACVKDHDVYGFTVLHHATLFDSGPIMTLLLKNGANPNAESRGGWRPLNYMSTMRDEVSIKKIEILLQYSARVGYNDDGRDCVNKFRFSMETFGSKDLALRVRAAHPRRINECEKCAKFAEKKCSGCKLVYYCTPACQKMDWTFHKVVCQND